MLSTGKMKTNRTMLLVLKETNKQIDNYCIVKTTVKMHIYGIRFGSVQPLSHVRLFATP